jgi:hypothetical protein
MFQDSSDKVHDLNSSLETENDLTMAHKLIGMEKLPELNTKAHDMRSELTRVFNKYQTVFEMNRVGTGNQSSAEDVQLKASVLRQYIGDAALDAIHPTGRDRTKTYEENQEIKAAIEQRFRPAYSEHVVRAQFVRTTMMEGQTSRDFLQACWEGIRRTCCQDPAEQLYWVLCIFTTRHANPEVRKQFKLKPPATKAEALQTVDDIESKQRERGTNERINAVLQETGNLHTAEVTAVNFRGRGGSRGRGSARQPTPQSNTNGSCNNCGGTMKCRNGQCPAVGATCYECGKTGHLGRVSSARKACLASQGRGGQNRPTQQRSKATYEGDATTDGHDGQHTSRSTTSYAEQSAVGYFPATVDEFQANYNAVQSNQMAYLQNITRQLNVRPTAQRTPKESSQAVVEVHVQFEPSSMDEVSDTKSNCNHEVWLESAEIRGKVRNVKIDTGARVNVMSRHHFLEIGFDPSQLRQSNVILVLFNQSLVCPLGCFITNVKIRDQTIPMMFHVVPTCSSILVCY